MSIYVIGDLHLSFSVDKPMDIFGYNWEKHAEKIKQNWIKKVKEDDTVILPGDFSWATYLEETYKDFEFLNSLPGRKIISKGNHDYWWTTVTSMKKFLKENNFNNIDFLYKEDGASLLARMLYEDCTHIDIIVGRAINPAHQNPGFPQELSIKLNIIYRLEKVLLELGKIVYLEMI